MSRKMHCEKDAPNNTRFRRICKTFIPRPTARRLPIYPSEGYQGGRNRTLNVRGGDSMYKIESGAICRARLESFHPSPAPATKMPGRRRDRHSFEVNERIKKHGRLQEG